MIEFQPNDYTLHTASWSSEDLESDDSTRFKSMESLENFKAWIEHVHNTIDSINLSDDDLDYIGINVYSHRHLYHLYKYRSKLKLFAQMICEYEGTVNRVQALEPGVSFSVFEFDNEDPLPKNL